MLVSGHLAMLGWGVGHLGLLDACMLSVIHAQLLSYRSIVVTCVITLLIKVAVLGHSGAMACHVAAFFAVLL